MPATTSASHGQKTRFNLRIGQKLSKRLGAVEQRAGCDRRWRSVEVVWGKIPVGLPEEVGVSGAEDR